MIWIRSLVFLISFYALTTFLALIGLPVLLIGRHRVQDYARFWTRASVRLLEVICGIKVAFQGLEHIPEGACLIAAKHQSALETLALTTITRDFSYVLKKELTAIPIFGWYLKGAEQIAIDRSKRAQALPDLIQQVREAVAEGRQIFIFPEGTRKPVGAPADYKAGIVQLYRETGAPCVPVALNSGLFWPRRGLSRYPGTATIAFLEPIPPGLDKGEFMRQLEARIEAGTAELVAGALSENPALKRALPQQPGAAMLDPSIRA
jgi:1-acyl-sn-glycerol-3-phosphate acyltransferase